MTGTCSQVPNITVCHVIQLTGIDISHEKIIRIVRPLNPNNAHCCDEISVRMIRFSDDALDCHLQLYSLTAIKMAIS